MFLTRTIARPLCRYRVPSSYLAPPASLLRSASTFEKTSHSIAQIESWLVKSGVASSSDCLRQSVPSLTTQLEMIDATFAPRQFISAIVSNTEEGVTISAEQASKIMLQFCQHGALSEISMLRSAVSGAKQQGASAGVSVPFSIEDVNKVLKVSISENVNEAMQWLFFAQDGLGLQLDQRSFDLIVPTLARERNWDQLLFVLAEMRLSGSQVRYSSKIVSGIVKNAQSDPLRCWDVVLRVLTEACAQRSCSGVGAPEEAAADPALSAEVLSAALRVFVRAGRPAAARELLRALSAGGSETDVWVMDRALSRTAGTAAIALKDAGMLVRIIGRDSSDTAGKEDVCSRLLALGDELVEKASAFAKETIASGKLTQEKGAAHLADRLTSEHARYATDVGLLIAWHLQQSTEISGSVDRATAAAVSLWNKYCKSLAALADAAAVADGADWSVDRAAERRATGSLEEAVRNSSSSCIEDLLSTVCTSASMDHSSMDIAAVSDEHGDKDKKAKRQQQLHMVAHFLSTVIFAESSGYLRVGTCSVGERGRLSPSGSAGTKDSADGGTAGAITSKGAANLRAHLVSGLHMTPSLANNLIKVFADAGDTFGTAATMACCLHDGAQISPEALLDVMTSLQKDKDHELVVQLLELHVQGRVANTVAGSDGQNGTRKNKKSSKGSSNGGKAVFHADLYVRGVESLVKLNRLDSALDLLLGHLPEQDRQPPRGAVLVLMTGLRKSGRYEEALQLFQAFRFPFGEDTNEEDGDDDDDLVEQQTEGSNNSNNRNSSSKSTRSRSSAASRAARRALLDAPLMHSALQCCALARDAMAAMTLFEHRNAVLQRSVAVGPSRNQLVQDAELVLVSLAHEDFVGMIVPFLQSLRTLSSPMDGSQHRLLKVALASALSVGRMPAVDEVIAHCVDAGFTLPRESGASDALHKELLYLITRPAGCIRGNAEAAEAVLQEGHVITRLLQ